MELLVQDHPEVAAIFITDGIMSDSEGGSPNSPLASYNWRDPQLTKLLHLLDQAHIQLAPTSRGKRERRNKVSQLAYPTNLRLQQAPANIPPNIPDNWVTPEAKASLSIVEKRGIQFRPAVNLSPACKALEDMLHKPTPTGF